MKTTSDSNVGDWAESVSAFMDGESEASGCAIDCLKQDSAAKFRWQRYHLIRDVVQGRSVEPIQTDFSDKVMRALQDEPVILVPGNLHSARNNVMKPFIGVGIAAAVASLTFYALQNLSPSEGPVRNEIRVVAAKPEKPVESLRVVSLQPTDYPAGQKHREEKDDLQKALNGYLMDHAGYSAVSNMHGMVPYARVAGYDVKHQ